MSKIDKLKCEINFLKRDVESLRSQLEAQRLIVQKCERKRDYYIVSYDVISISILADKVNKVLDHLNLEYKHFKAKNELVKKDK